MRLLSQFFIKVLNRLLKYGYFFILLFLGYSQVLAFSTPEKKKLAEQTEQLIIDAQYQQAEAKDFRFEAVCIEERFESEDDEEHPVSGDDASFYLSFLINGQPHYLHHAGNRVLSNNPRLSIASVVSSHIVHRVLRL